MSSQLHWEKVYHTEHVTEVSWFETQPANSLALIHSIAPHGGIPDLGPGSSVNCATGLSFTELRVRSSVRTAGPFIKRKKRRR
jgi:hypothetical protein